MIDFERFIRAIEQNRWEVYGVEAYAGHRRIHSYGDTTNGRHFIYSSTKTLTALAVGMAQDEGKMDIHKPLPAYLPAKALADLSDRQRRLIDAVTIERLLTMSVDGFPFRPEGASWLYNALRYPIREEPSFLYSNVSAYLAGVAAANALDEDLYGYLNRRLFLPLGIENPPYQRCPDGYFYGATGMQMTVEELSRIGFLLADGGVYDGQRIVSSDYIGQMCSPHQSNGQSLYGYYVWVYEDGGWHISGKWGQECYFFPKKDLMVTFLSHIEENDKQISDCMKECLV